MSRFAPRVFALLVTTVLLVGALASPALAAPGSNTTGAAACEDGGYLNYVDTQGNGFKNEGQCTRYTARGGILVDTRAVASITATSGSPYVYTNPDGTWRDFFNIQVSGENLLPYAGVAITHVFTDDRTPATVVYGAADEYGTHAETFMIACGVFDSFTFSSVDRRGNPVETSVDAAC